ncbi:MAG TPA: DinB family protein [Holophagaceae bacterium]|nr:DinB family protein [Holophagaceae bacterium]
MTLPADLLASLRSMPDQVEALLRQVPEQRLAWTPDSWEAVPGERFSARGQVCHLRDIEVEGYRLRIRRMRDEEAPDLASLDSYALAAANRYDAVDVREALAAFRAAREATLELISPLTGAQLERRGTFAEYGRLSLGGLLHLLASHDAQHLACLRWLLAKMSGAAC